MSQKVGKVVQVIGPVVDINLIQMLYLIYITKLE